MAELTSGINQLIERIKNEGVAKGEAESARILREAKVEAQRILDEARSEATSLITKAEAERDALKKRADSELRLAIRDFIADFAERIRKQIIEPAATEKVRETIASPAFLGETLKQIVTDYVAAGGTAIEAVVSDELREQLGAYFADACGERLMLSAEQGLAGFRLRREHEGFTWDFTLEAVVAELQRLVDPTLRPFFSLTPPGGTPEA